MDTVAYRQRSTSLLALLLAISGSARAATITVDGVNCQLVDAIKAANTDTAVGNCSKGSLADTLKLTRLSYLVKFDRDQFNTDDGYTGLPSITSEIIIDGNPDTKGKNAVIYRDPGLPDPYFGLTRFRLFRIASTGTLTLERTTVKLGNVTTCSWCARGYSGGGFINYGKVTLIASTLEDNAADYGGGFANQGQVIIRDSVVKKNTAQSGGGFYNGTGNTVTLIDSELYGNNAVQTAKLQYPSVGGGFATWGKVTASGTTFTSNFAGSADGAKGGGLYSGSSGLVQLNNCALAGNSANSDFYDALGGGIYNQGGTVLLNNSTLAGNSAKLDKWSSHSAWGGGLSSSGGRIALNHSSVSGNLVEHGSIGGEGFVILSGIAVLKNSLITNSKGGSDCWGSGGSVVFAGANLVEDGSCGAVAAGMLTGDPKLGKLLDNGGTTLTLAPAATSKLIDTAPLSSCLAKDQRGIGRPQGKRCDIGAFERVLTAQTQVQPIVRLFDRSVTNGSLSGIGRSAVFRKARSDAVRHQVLAAGALLNQGTPVAAVCRQLSRTLTRIDSNQTVDNDDYVTGTAAAQLATMIGNLRADLGC